MLLLSYPVPGGIAGPPLSGGCKYGEIDRILARASSKFTELKQFR
jgi:hypothetical protein